MRTITVTGIGTSHIAPDTAIVRVSAVQRGDGVAEAYEEMSATAGTLVEVAARHTDKRSIASTGISVWPWHDHEGKPSGYEARHGYTVDCDDLAAAGTLLTDLAHEIGDALAVDSVGLEVTDNSVAVFEAREAAFSDARERAAGLARMGGLGLGIVQSIVEHGNAVGPAPMGATKFSLASDAGGLEPGETTVSCSVTVVWELI